MKKIYFLGIDVAKDSCDFALLNAKGSRLWSAQFDNNPTSIQAWLKGLEARGLGLSQILFGFEATGVYSQALLLSLQQANLAVCLLNPARVKYFGVSILRRTKNDRADALLIARYVLERQPVTSRPLRPVEHQLKELVHEREALGIDLARERNRTERYRIASLKDPPLVLLNQSKQRLAQFKTWLGELDLAIKNLIESDRSLRTQAQLLCSIPGIALCSAAKILSQLAGKEFQSAHQLALYAGLNPMHNQSGRCNGKTALSKIGNALLRKALFLPASVALRYCAPVKLWAQQIQSRRPELSKLQIRGAVMHKLIRIIFGVLKHHSPFDPNLASAFNPA
jgi:transposase